MTELLGLLADVLPWIEETCSDPGLLPTAPGALEELQALRDRIQRALDDRAADLTAIEPAPEVCALQKALEALEAAEVDLYPRDVQPTHVVRNRIQFAAFVLRRHLAQAGNADSLTPNAEVRRPQGRADSAGH